MTLDDSSVPSMSKNAAMPGAAASRPAAVRRPAGFLRSARTLVEAAERRGDGRAVHVLR